MKLIDFLSENVQSKIALLTRKFPEESKEKIEKVVTYFEKMGLDLNKFKTFGEMFAKTLEKSKTQLKKKGKVLVFKNNKAKVYRIDTQEACQTYSGRAMWCITGHSLATLDDGGLSDWIQHTGSDEEGEGQLNRQFFFVETKSSYFSDQFKKQWWYNLSDEYLQNLEDRESIKFSNETDSENIETVLNDSKAIKQYSKQFFNVWAIAVYRKTGVISGIWDAADGECEDGTNKTIDMFLKELEIPKNVFVIS